jgi:hypothetical protein
MVDEVRSHEREIMNLCEQGRMLGPTSSRSASRQRDEHALGKERDRSRKALSNLLRFEPNILEQQQSCLRPETGSAFPERPRDINKQMSTGRRRPAARSAR